MIEYARKGKGKRIYIIEFRGHSIWTHCGRVCYAQDIEPISPHPDLVCQICQVNMIRAKERKEAEDVSTGSTRNRHDI